MEISSYIALLLLSIPDEMFMSLMTVNKLLLLLLLLLLVSIKITVNYYMLIVLNSCHSPLVNIFTVQ